MHFFLIFMAVFIADGTAGKLWADNPGFGAYYDTPVDKGVGKGAGSLNTVPASTPVKAAATPTPSPADPAAADKQPRSCQPVCYNTPNPAKGVCPAGACLDFEKSHPNYFSNIDASCQLPAGTALTMAGIESSCRTGANSRSGTYKGMFQFSASSCPRGDLRDPSVQAQCMCDYTANSRKQYMNASGGQLPSAGMYYLFHQQGGCGIKLALGGSARAVDVVSQCVSPAKCGGSGGCAKSREYAQKAIGWNLPKGSGMSAESVSAEQFANIYLSKFSHIDNNNICMGDGAAANAANAGADSQALTPLVEASRALTSNGTPLTTSFIQQLLATQDLSAMFAPLFNPRYDQARDPDAEDDDDKASDDKTTKDKVVVTDTADGSKTVTVQADGDVSTYSVKAGAQLWECAHTYLTVTTAPETTAQMQAQACQLITAVPAVVPAAVTTTTP